MSFAQFKNTFVEFTIMKKRIGNQVVTREWINGYHNVDYLYNLIAPYIYKCTLNLELDKQYINVDYKIESELIDKYNELKEHFLELENMAKWNNNIFLMMTQKMQHSYALAEEKFEYIDNFIKTNDKSKMLIVAKFRSSYRELEKRCPDIKILSYGRHSFGLNLQDYDTIIFFDKTFDYGKQEQIEHRIYRTGQKSKAIRYITLNGDVKLENLILQNIQKKTRLLDMFKNKVKLEELI